VIVVLGFVVLLEVERKGENLEGSGRVCVCGLLVYYVLARRGFSESSAENAI
jgi:hypothetical protein